MVMVFGAAYLIAGTIHWVVLATFPVFDGGTKADHEALLAVHHGFLAANDPLDPAMLRKVWDDDPSRAFFNTNGHTSTAWTTGCVCGTTTARASG